MTSTTRSSVTFEAEAESADGSLPSIDFSTFALSLSHSALVHLGDAPNPEGGQTSVSLALARQMIDVLTLLEHKTRGNLTGEEERLLEQLLYDLRLRLRFVEVQRHHG